MQQVPINATPSPLRRIPLPLKWAAGLLLCLYAQLLGAQQTTNPQTPANNSHEDSSVICLTCNELQESPKLKKALQKLHNVRVNNAEYILQDYPSHPANGQLKKSLPGMPPVRNAPNSGKNAVNPADTLFTIIHIGDSHIQGDYFSGEIRMQLQSQFGNAGRGILFPYALAKSFGPRGVSVKPQGLWTGVKTLTQSLTLPLGVSGYGATTNSLAASLNVSLTEKFAENNALGNFSVPQMQRINIWHSADDNSFTTQLNPEFMWTGSQFYPSGWGVSSYQAQQPTNNFTLGLISNSPNQNHYAFYGFEIIPQKQRGVVYHHCGVVGAQFTHLINKAPQTVEQIAHLKPDILIFSFGTNEAYNGKLDTQIYTPAVMKFLADIAAASPNTAIILTTAPDTRSRNRIPPAQKSVNQQLQKIAATQKLTLYDLNKAMGGWGSLHIWYNHKLTLTDKLHFNAAGYALQGQLFTLSLLQAYNKANPKDTLNISALKNTVHVAMSTLVRDFSAVSLGDSLANDTAKSVTGQTRANPVTNNTNGIVPATTQDSVQQNPRTNTIAPQRYNTPQRSTPANNRSPRMSQGEVTHTVKSGENLYRIAQRYNVTHESIAKRNKLSNPRALRIGQRLIIPAR
jgi:LysM repeat protein